MYSEHLYERRESLHLHSITGNLCARLNTQVISILRSYTARANLRNRLLLHFPPTLLITRLLISPPLNSPPLLPIIRIIHRIGGNTHSLILDLLRQYQIQKDRKEPRDREPRFHDQNNRIEETLLGLIGPTVREHIGEPLGHEDGADAQRQRGGEDEPVAPREGHGGDDADARDGDAGEEEGGEAAQDGGGDRDERGGEFREDAHDEEKEAGAVAGLAIRAAGQCDDSVVLVDCQLYIVHQAQINLI